MLDLLEYVLPFFSSTWLPPLLLISLPACLPCSPFIHQLSVCFNLVVANLLSLLTYIISKQQETYNQTKGLQRVYKGGNRQPHMLG